MSRKGSSSFRSAVRWAWLIGFAVSLSVGSAVRAALQQESQPAPNDEQNPASQTDSSADPQKQDSAATRAQAREKRQTSREPSQRVQEILRNLDPKMLNLSGAQLDVEVVGENIILRGNQQDIDLIELLITVLKTTSEPKELRVLTVTEKDANDIAKTAGPALREILKRPNQRDEELVEVTALSSTILLVSALPDEIDFVVETIQKIDAVKDELPPLEQLVFPILHRKATDVADQLTEIIKKIQERKGATGAKGEIQIIANEANNSVMVLAPEKERSKFERLIAEIDVEPVTGWGEMKLTLYPLLHSKASEMEKVITDLLKTPKGREQAEEMIFRLQISKSLPDGQVVDLPPIDLQKPTRIIADEGTNSLIVATAEENVGPLGDLVRLLDGVPLGTDVDVMFFPMRFADAETIADVLKKMFDEGPKLPEDPDGSGQGAVPENLYGKALVYKIGFSADVRTNTLIVSGRQEQLLLVAEVVGRLDRPANALKFPLRMLQLEHTDASQVAKIVTELLDQRMKSLEATNAGTAAIERDRVFLTVDIRSNSLILSASEENYEEIENIARQLDTKPAQLFDQIRIVRLERLSAEDMKTKIEELWKRKADLRREEELLEDLPVIAVDSRSNALIIASSIEDYEEIKRLIETLESQTLIEDTRLFALEYADANVLSGMLKQLFEGIAGQSESFQAPTILPDPRSNALVIAGSRDALERAEHLVRRLDVQSGPTTALFRVYPLQHASAAQLAPRMQELFDSRAQGGDIEKTPIVVLPEEASNSIVVSASNDDQEIVVDLLGLLDRPSSLARQFEIFPLKKAKADAVAEKLDTLFKSQGQGAGAGRTDAIAAQVDERTNSIIVWASPSQLINIAQVIARLDTSTPAVEMMIRVIPLRQALATDFADLLNRTLNEEGGGGDKERAVIVSFLERQKDGSDALRKLIRQDIKIESDPRTNSLMVMAPGDSMAMLEAMIKDFDAIRPIRSEIRLFPLINSDAKSMVDRLTELFTSQGGAAEGETKSQLVFGDTIGDLDVASVGQELRFTADTRTNTLIAAGAEVDLRMVEELIRFLDSQEAEDRVVEVLQTNYLDPDEIASAIQGFNGQEQEAIGALEDEEARIRQMERQISVEAVGTQEQGGRSLIVGTSRRAYQDTMAMIQALDRPEPQVVISVVIAEVTLTDNFEFGMEFAGQDLPFSEKAVVGPNNIIQGSNFDFTIGTDLGAAVGGLGGFGFTINGEDFAFLFRTLQQTSRLEVLSGPTLTVRNGEEGSITIADQVPFVQSSQINDTGSTNSVIGREDVGIVLTATPHISPDGYVTIELSQEISNFSGENLQLTEGVSSPVFNTREVKTNVTVRDGETVVIGGLITSRKSEGESKVPILGDLPYVGPLFRVTRSGIQKTELMIAMTVDIVRSDDEMRQRSTILRDRFSESRSFFTDPLLQGLRITPDESLMGRDGGKGEPSLERPESKPPPKPSEEFGPKPKTYGPVIPRPKPTTTTAADMPVYGPSVVRNEYAETLDD